MIKKNCRIVYFGGFKSTWRKHPGRGQLPQLTIVPPSSISSLKCLQSCKNRKKKKSILKLPYFIYQFWQENWFSDCCLLQKRFSISASQPKNFYAKIKKREKAPFHCYHMERVKLHTYIQLELRSCCLNSDSQSFLRMTL